MTTLYTPDHEWVRANTDGTYTVGITHHAQDQLGDLVFIELPNIGRVAQKGDSVAVAESTKAASDIYAPLSGEITAINAGAVNEPAIVNTNPQQEGWLFAIRPSAPAELEDLLSEADYLALIAG